MQQFDRDLRRRRERLSQAAAARLAAELARLRSDAAADRERAAATATAPTVDIAAYERQLASAAEDLESVTQELENQRVAAEEAEQAWVEADEERELLAQRNRSLLGQLEGLKAQLRQRADSAGEPATTAEDEFMVEVEASWRERLTQDDRGSHPLAPYEIRDGFIESITKAVADRQKVVDTVMEIVCDPAKAIDGRNLHKLRTGPGGGNPYRQRKSDGASAWRCNVQTGAPSARRIHYWVAPGGAIELVSVVIHDDFTIAE